MIALTLPTPEHTMRFAAGLARLLVPGDVVLLAGTVGAGKTTFVRGVAETLGCVEPVRSPTYTIAHVYEARDRSTIAHLDLYRDGAMDEQAWGDIEPVVDAATWTFVEWPGAGARWLASRATWQVELDVLDEWRRLARITGRDRDRLRALADAAVQLVR